jgi:hypothetical protein
MTLRIKLEQDFKALAAKKAKENGQSIEEFCETVLETALQREIGRTAPTNKHSAAKSDKPVGARIVESLRRAGVIGKPWPESGPDSQLSGPALARRLRKRSSVGKRFSK